MRICVYVLGVRVILPSEASACPVLDQAATQHTQNDRFLRHTRGTEDRQMGQCWWGRGQTPAQPVFRGREDCQGDLATQALAGPPEPQRAPGGGLWKPWRMAESCRWGWETWARPARLNCKLPEPMRAAIRRGGDLTPAHKSRREVIK